MMHLIPFTYRIVISVGAIFTPRACARGKVIGRVVVVVVVVHKKLPDLGI